MMAKEGGSMRRRVLGLIVAGGGAAAFDALGGVEDAALMPFAGKYRFVDFALATFLNSDVRPVYVVAPGPAPALRAHLTRAGQSGGEPRRSLLISWPDEGGAGGRAERVLRALAGCRELVEACRPEAVALVHADHILQLDLRQLQEAHRDLRAHVTLAALPVPLGEAASRTVLRVGGDQRLHEAQEAPVLPAAAPGSRGFALTWAGDMMVDAAALREVLETAAPLAGADDVTLLERLADGLRVMAYDVLDNRLPGATNGRGTYWHEPTTLEVYYEAQMNLCTPSPTLDLYNPEWPLPPIASGLAPAKVVADAVGRAGQAHNSLVSDGAVIRGGAAINTILGHGVVIESGAEVEDSVLLDGCRIGRGARVRRALVGAGAVIGDGGEIGYGGPPVPSARLLPSGLTIVLAASPAAVAAASGAR
jgi:glucose-1-phosphate adenylyltransferase